MSQFFVIKNERRIKIKKENSTKDWIPLEKIYLDGIILTDNSYIKILKVIPINYDLKSNLEKEAILNSYKLFLKVCDFNIQILIQSKKENFSKYFENLKEISQKEKNEKIKKIITDFEDALKEKNNENKAASKDFFLIVKYDFSKNKKENTEKEETLEMARSYLNECYFKIKDSLSRCGNIVYDYISKEEVYSILKTFF